MTNRVVRVSRLIDNLTEYQQMAYETAERLWTKKSYPGGESEPLDLTRCTSTIKRGHARYVGKQCRQQAGRTRNPAATLNATSMLLGAAVLLLASLAAGDGIRLPSDAGTWAAVAYLSLVGSVLAFLLYFSLLKTWSVMSLSFISVFTPVIALLLGFVFLHEALTPWKVGGAVLILVAVALANRQR